MQDLLSQMSNLRRPRLLIRAARIGLESYRRESRLPRLLGYAGAQRSGPALMALMQKELELNEQRKSGDASYSIAAHVDVLTAMMGEARILRAQTPRIVTPDPT